MLTFGLLFWLLMILWLIGWLGVRWGVFAGPPYVYANEILFFILLFLLGVHVFGWPIHA